MCLGLLPSSTSLHLQKGDHTKLGTSEYLDSDGMQQYQSMIGTIQWTVSLGRLDMNDVVMTVASFRAEPRQVHLKSCKRFFRAYPNSNGLLSELGLKIWVCQLC